MSDTTLHPTVAEVERVYTAFEYVQQSNRSYGADDTEPAGHFCDVVIAAFNGGDVKIPNSPQEWELYSNPGFQEAVSRSLAIRAKAVVEAIQAVPSSLGPQLRALLVSRLRYNVGLLGLNFNGSKPDAEKHVGTPPADHAAITALDKHGNLLGYLSCPKVYGIDQMVAECVAEFEAVPYIIVTAVNRESGGCPAVETFTYGQDFFHRLVDDDSAAGFLRDWIDDLDEKGLASALTSLTAAQSVKIYGNKILFSPPTS